MSEQELSTRLLIYSDCFWPSIGGVETYARLLAEGIAKDQSFHITFVTQTPVVGIEPRWDFQLYRKPGFWRLWQIVRISGVVFIAGPALLPIVLAILARKPFVIEHHGYQAACPNGLLLNKARGGICAEAFRKRRFGECLRCGRANWGTLKAFRQLALTIVRNWVCRRAYAHVAVSEHVRKRHGLPNMQVIYHGIADLPSSALPKVAEHGPSGVHFGYSGRLVEEKGLPLLIEASRKLKSRGLTHHISFIGDGPLKEYLRTQADAAGLDVTFTGFLQGPALRHVTDDLDVLIMPSICEETAGLAAMEQMMRGRAVLAADIGGLGEIVGDGGVKFQPFDAEDLARKMTELINPEIRSKVGAGGRARAIQLFELERMVREHKALFLQGCKRQIRLEQNEV